MRGNASTLFIATALAVPLVLALLLARMIWAPSAEDVMTPVSPTRAVVEGTLTTPSGIAADPTPPPTVAPPTRTAATPTAPPMPLPEATPSPVPTPAAVAHQTYTVQPGDQLKHIAARYGVELWDIVAVNDIPDPDNLRVGQVLTIPARPGGAE